MGDVEKVLTLNNEVEAGLMEEILEDEGIPFHIESNYSLAYDGIFQINQGWGYIEAEPKYKKRIRELYKQIKEQ